MASCYGNTSLSFTAPDMYFMFSVGQNSGRLWWVLVEDQKVSPDISGSALGSYDPSNPEHTDWPGPIMFNLSHPTFGPNTIRGFQVDDRGAAPIFYIATADFTANEVTVHKFNEAGTSLGTRILYPDFATLSTAEMVGVNNDEVVVTVSSTDFVESQTSIYFVDLDMGYSFSPFTSDPAPFGTPGYVGTVVTSESYTWLVSSLTGNTPGFYSAVVWDDGAFYWDEFDLGIADSVSIFDIDIGFDCTSTDLTVYDDVSGETNRFSSAGASTSTSCIKEGELAHNGTDLLIDEGGVGDGATTQIQVVSCASILKPLRQKQRDDQFNAPRAWGGHNNPTSRQHSLRASAGNNTYLKDDLLVGCGC